MVQIVTSEEGLEAQDVRLATAAGETSAYFAKPALGASLPVVLVAEEIFGLNDHIRDIARRFAQAGYFAIAPDFLARAGDVANAPDISAIRAIVAKVADGDVIGDFDAALEFAGSHGGDVARAAVTGFCWGGRMAWLYAAHNPKIKAAIPWYGRLDGERTAEQPRWPIDVAGEIRVPTLGLYGGADPSIPLGEIEAMRKKLRAAGAPADFVIYEGAPHAFFADYRESYKQGPAEDAWRRALAFLRKNGVG
jgi:carboxymethylenebutenolidase